MRLEGQLTVVRVAANGQELDRRIYRREPVSRQKLDTRNGWLWVLAASAGAALWHALGVPLVTAPLGLITSAALNGLALAMAGGSGVDVSGINWHWSGVSAEPESIDDTGLYAPIPTLPKVAGEQTVPAAGVYRSTATLMYDDTYTIVEWGIYDTSGLLWDRAVIDPQPVYSGTGLRFIYELTILGA